MAEKYSTIFQIYIAIILLLGKNVWPHIYKTLCIHAVTKITFYRNLVIIDQK